jgi:EAL domain-containing protein (putative c-di-GMP-specific phosphodiesterase class I)
VDRHQIETELRRGIERNEFDVFYQALVSLGTGSLAGFEALVRWRHPTRGLVSPTGFIPVAEETGMIVPLGQLVLETACRQMRIWQTYFAGSPVPIIAVNLSARHFQNPELLEQCRIILDQTGLPPQSLHLEVTESTVMPDPVFAATLMGRLKSLGLKLALDDFGTGYSSLSYLHRFPLDKLKIDRSFVAQMAQDTEQLEIVRTIVNLGHNLGLQVIAEGIETVEQVRLLRKLGCDFCQGYLFSVPINAEKTTDLLVAKPKW